MVNYKDVMDILEIFEQEIRTIIPSIKTLIHIDTMCIKVEASFQDVDDVLVVLRGTLHEAALPVDALALGHLQLHLAPLFRQIGLVSHYNDWWW